MKFPIPDPSGASQAILGRLLIVDDEAELMMALGEMLARQGYEATGFTSGEEALAALREDEFDLILTDLMMPGIDGIELLRAGQAIDSHLLGILMTGQATVQTALEAMKAGAFDYLLKPFKLSAVLPILVRALEARSLRLENVQLNETVAIYGLSQAIALTLDLDTILNKTAEAALQQCEADEATIMLPVPERNELYVAAVRGRASASILGERVSLDAGIAGWVARQREPLNLQGQVNDPRFAPLYPRPDLQAAISIPMLAGDRLVGVLNVNSTRHRRFTLGQVKALSILVSTAAAALENAWLHTQARTAEKHFRALIENASDIITELDINGTIGYMSPAIERVLGYAPDELVGRSVFELVHPEDLDATSETFARTFLTPGVRATVEVRLRHKDGSWRVFESIGKSALDEAGRLHGIINSRDITERKKHETHLEVIASVGAALRGASTRPQVISIIIEQLMGELHIDGATLEILDPDTGVLTIELASGFWASATGQLILPGMGLSAEVLASGQPFFSNEPSAQQRLFRTDLSPDCQGVAGAPLISEDQITGLIWIGSLGVLGEHDLRLLVAVAEMGASALRRAALHEQTLQQLDRLAALRAIDQAITGSFDIQLTLSILLEQGLRQLGAEAALVWLLHQPSLTLENVAGRGLSPTTLAKIKPIRLGQGYAGRAALKRQMVRIENLQTQTDNPEMINALAGENFTNYYGVPLLSKGKVKGVLEVFYRTSRNPDNDQLNFLETLAGQAAIAIDNAALFSDLQRSNDELELAYDTTIEGWSQALDLRDKETEGHSLRVTVMTMKLARAMGIQEEQLLHVRRGALLHDIGKMGVPDAILLKPGQLTDEEWVIMRKHPTFAYELLSPISYLRAALIIPYCHHEKWDGSGYPRGLKSQAIPLAARIFAVVDVWDALRSDRPYRQGWPIEKVRAHIQAEAGQHFDPAVVEVFMALERT